jgi:hypothetical protein
MREGMEMIRREEWERRSWEHRGDWYICPTCGQNYIDSPALICSMGYGPSGIRMDLDAGMSIANKPAHPLCVICTRRQED